MKTLFVIDDEEEVLNATSSLLEMNGYHVYSFVDPIKMINKIKEQEPDLILCDIMMPEMDGHGVLREVRNRGLKTPFVFLTAKAQYEDIRAGMDLGADDYILKPFKAKALVNAIDVRLNRFNLFDQTINLLENTVQLMTGHELNTPMHGIKSFLDLIKSKADRLNDSELLDFCLYLEKSVLRLQNTFGKVKTFFEIRNQRRDAQVETNKIDLVFEMHTLIHSVATDHDRTNDLHFICPPLIVIETNRSLFFTAVFEIVQNAFKFSKNGERVFVSIDKENDKILINISNNNTDADVSFLNSLIFFNQMNRQQFEQQGLGVGIALTKLVFAQLGIELKFLKSANDLLTARITIPFNSN